jgi:hypothetical protein
MDADSRSETKKLDRGVKVVGRERVSRRPAMATFSEVYQFILRIFRQDWRLANRY